MEKELQEGEEKESGGKAEQEDQGDGGSNAPVSSKKNTDIKKMCPK